MVVYLLIREDQNEHGFVVTTIAGVFQDEAAARRYEQQERHIAAVRGLIVEGDDSPDGEWQVAWAIEEHVVRSTGKSSLTR